VPTGGWQPASLVLGLHRKACLVAGLMCGFAALAICHTGESRFPPGAGNRLPSYWTCIARPASWLAWCAASLRSPSVTPAQAGTHWGLATGFPRTGPAPQGLPRGWLDVWLRYARHLSHRRKPVPTGGGQPASLVLGLHRKAGLVAGLMCGFTTLAICHTGASWCSLGAGNRLPSYWACTARPAAWLAWCVASLRSSSVTPAQAGAHWGRATGFPRTGPAPQGLPRGWLDVWLRYARHLSHRRKPVPTGGQQPASLAMTRYTNGAGLSVRRWPQSDSAFCRTPSACGIPQAFPLV